jgi:hypothetical protein
VKAETVRGDSILFISPSSLQFMTLHLSAAISLSNQTKTETPSYNMASNQQSTQASTSQGKAHLSYSARIPYQNNAAAAKLLELMERKKTNLCVSVDVTKGEDMLEVVRRVGKSCCMIKASLLLLSDDRFFSLVVLHRPISISLRILLWISRKSLSSSRRSWIS